MRLGDYEVLGELGRGGSGRVFRALGPDRKKLVAVKVLLNKERPDSFARFAREQKLLDRLGEAEGFVPLLDYGDSPHGPYLVMPLLTGGTLRQRLAKGALELEECLRIMRPIAAAMGLAHDRGIVHRDLKPENILFNAAGRPLIADLGIAKYLGTSTSLADSSFLTKQGAFLGTPGYMAPEQMGFAEAADPRSDVFSLGAMTYECLAGRGPFEGESRFETSARTLEGRHTPIDEVRIDLSYSFAHTIEVALEVKPEDRYENALKFAGALGAQAPQNAPLKPTEKEGPPEIVVARAAPWRFPARALWLVPIVVLPIVTFVMGSRMAQPAPSVAPVAPAKPVVPPKPVAPAPKGWFGETLPPNVRLGAERPVYVYDTTKGLELELVYVPPGDFSMGAINGGPVEKPLHTHPMPWGYYIARAETTWDQYRAFCRATTRAEPALPSWPITGSHPVVNVSWFDAVAFCEWAGLSLPNEAEWEKAARGEDWRQWPWGDQWVPGNANVIDVSSPFESDPGLKEADDGYPYTAPVMSFPKGVSPCGAHDMAGNAAEWTADWFDPAIYAVYSEGRFDPPSHGDHRCVRGGSWQNPRYSCTVSQRVGYQPQGLSDFLGFRPCLRTKK